jgi:hypothetical protein
MPKHLESTRQNKWVERLKQYGLFDDLYDCLNLPSDSRGESDEQRKIKVATRIVDMYKEFSDGIHGRMALDMTKAELIIGRPLSRDQKCVIKKLCDAMDIIAEFETLPASESDQPSDE